MATSDFPDFPSLGKKDKSDEETYIPEYVPVDAATLNLSSELLGQYNNAKKLFHNTSYDMGIPASQKAQILNTITSIIAAIVRGQEQLYSIEEMKKIERALLKCLKEYPDLQRSFMEAYSGELLGELRVS
jgi:hypothetical protein